jgi:hypothetical protein
MKNLKYAVDVTSVALNSFIVSGLGGQADLGEAWGRAKQLPTNKPKIRKLDDLIF